MSTFASVVIPPLPQAFTYEVPPPLSSEIKIGHCVRIPFGKRTTQGYVVSLQDSAPEKQAYALKSIVSLETSSPHFHPSQLPFFEWVSHYYGATLSEVLDVAIPPFVLPRNERIITLLESASPVKGALQKKILEALRNAGGTLTSFELQRLVKGNSSALTRLQELNHLRIETVTQQRRPLTQDPIAAWAKQEVQLNTHQQEAYQQIINALDTKSFSPFLLHGITGSGKTEIYIDAALHCLQQQRGALIIVPEIALTPQLIDRFRARIGTEIAILHSGLDKRTRWEGWQALLEGRARIAIGARSGIFAPVPSLGLLIVDEEHDGSYKQSEGLRYHARDLALVRAHQDSSVVVLGSATPSLETYYHARKEKYRYLRLPARHGGATRAPIEVVDLAEIKPWEMKSRSISPLLFERLVQTIERGEQAFILYNRRGFAAYFECERCHAPLSCPHCSVTLTFHKEVNALLCHYCGYSLVPPHRCITCPPSPHPAATSAAKSKSPALPDSIYVMRGGGTEKVEEELRSLFPQVAIARLDRDTASDTADFRSILECVRSGKTQILVGTQMIAKGHDLPGVTLVGVVDCDVGLHMPDYRANERVFQLLTQVAGRAGRGEKKGSVFLQTRMPLHRAITHTVTHDYEGFALSELRERKDLLYPPYTRLLRVVVSSQEQQYPPRILESFKRHLTDRFAKGDLSCIVLGPAPAPLLRVRGEWRWHLLVRSSSPAHIQEVFNLLLRLKIKTGKARIVYDRDPQEMW